MTSSKRQKDNSRRFYERNKEFYLRKNKERRGIASQYIKELKESSPCMDCGRFYPPICMDFDHVRGKKIKNVSTLVTHGIDAVKKEITKCELVCSNCHRVRTQRRLTSHVQHASKAKAKNTRKR